MEKLWLKHYPAGVPAEIDVAQYASLVELLETSFSKFRDRPAYKFMGKSITFGEVDAQSRAFAAYLQAEGFVKGDRIALMMPNVPQYPIAIAGVLRAGCVVVNVNPLYTPRELEHQLKDSGATCVVVLENFAHTLQQVLPTLLAPPSTAAAALAAAGGSSVASSATSAPQLKKIIVTGLGDLLGWPKSWLVNYVVRHVKKMVPVFDLPGSVRFNAVLSAGRQHALRPTSVGPADIAVLQYTGGTTGVSKGAVLLHRNLIANILQCETWYAPALKKIPAGTQILTVAALPIYHIFGFTANIMLMMRMGGCNLLIVNPRDLPAMFKDLAREPFHSLPAVSTLFDAMAHHASFGKVDWSALVISVGGGMAVRSTTAQLWLDKTGCPIVEGYGLSETSPTATCNPINSTEFSGNIGLPMPNTEIQLLDDDGAEVPMGTPGEIAIRGPQVMPGYWQRPDETAKVMTADGFFRSGDIGTVDARGYFKIVDRKKDMILVSGFNVYPNEIEDVVASCPGVMECAAIGVADEKSGEAVKLFVVKKNAAELTEAELMAYCHKNLTGYKCPKKIVFRASLPKSNVGKILRRELRDK